MNARTTYEDEEERRGESTQFIGIAFTVLRQAQRDSDDDPTCRTGSRRNHHDPSSTISLNHKPCQEAENQVVDRSSGGKDPSDQLVEVDGVDEDVSLEIAGHIDSADLVHGLHPSAEDHASDHSGWSATGEELPPGVGLAMLFVKDIFDDVVLCAYDR